jgi:DsbC/DsbD-like thiol-disulfide interchange protein
MSNMAFARTWPIAALIFLLLACPGMAEDANFASLPSKAAHSSARILAGSAPQIGVYHAGVEISLAPRTITYWRQPGDTGAPPVFDFSRSDNVASVEVLFPAPKHIAEADGEVAGYDERVIFPLRVTPKDPASPVSLRLGLDYAACGNICLPAKAQLSLVLPKTGVSPYADDIAVAESKTPKKIASAEAKKLFAVRRAGSKDSRAWELRYLGQSPVRDLFVEAPEPLYLESKRAASENSFDLRLASSGGTESPSSIVATVTILTEAGAIEAPAELD